MTDEELIEKYEDMEGNAEFRRIVGLARLGLERTPPEGAIKVRMAAAATVDGQNLRIGFGDYNSITNKTNAAQAIEHLGSEPEYLGNVEFWLPPLKVETVEGRVEG